MLRIIWIYWVQSSGWEIHSNCEFGQSTAPEVCEPSAASPEDPVNLTLVSMSGSLELRVRVSCVHLKPASLQQHRWRRSNDNLDERHAWSASSSQPYAPEVCEPSAASSKDWLFIICTMHWFIGRVVLLYWLVTGYAFKTTTKTYTYRTESDITIASHQQRILH